MNQSLRSKISMSDVNRGAGLMTAKVIGAKYMLAESMGVVNSLKFFDPNADHASVLQGSFMEMHMERDVANNIDSLVIRDRRGVEITRYSQLPQSDPMARISADELWDSFKRALRQYNISDLKFYNNVSALVEYQANENFVADPAATIAQTAEQSASHFILYNKVLTRSMTSLGLPLTLADLTVSAEAANLIAVGAGKVPPAAMTDLLGQIQFRTPLASSDAVSTGGVDLSNGFYVDATGQLTAASSKFMANTLASG
jgi:hypothetical protein